MAISEAQMISDLHRYFFPEKYAEVKPPKKSAKQIRIEKLQFVIKTKGKVK